MAGMVEHLGWIVTENIYNSFIILSNIKSQIYAKNLEHSSSSSHNMLLLMLLLFLWRRNGR